MKALNNWKGGGGVGHFPLLLVLLSSIAVFVLLGLALMIFRMIGIQGELATLRDSALPRLLQTRFRGALHCTYGTGAGVFRPEVTTGQTSFRVKTQFVVLRENGELLTNNLQRLNRGGEQRIIATQNRQFVSDNVYRILNLLLDPNSADLKRKGKHHAGTPKRGEPKRGEGKERIRRWRREGGEKRRGGGGGEEGDRGGFRILSSAYG